MSAKKEVAAAVKPVEETPDIAPQATADAEWTRKTYKFRGVEGYRDEDELIVMGLGAFKKGESVTSTSPEHTALIEASKMFSAGARYVPAQEE